MSQLIDNLNIIESVKTDIKSAIENKGVDMTGVSFPGYASKIGEITTSFVTETLNVSANGTYNPGQGVDGYSQVVVDVPISGWDQKSITEGMAEIINLDNSASFVASSAFNGNGNIQTVNLPYVTSVSQSAFYRCISLSQVSLPVCSYIDIDVFYDCNKLSQVNFPVCSYIGKGAFQFCNSLSQVSLSMCSYIGSNAFRYCNKLSIITLGYSGVCSLNSSDTFNGTKITSSTGSIYVPASLVDSYKSANYWSYFSTQIFPISE